MKKKIDKIALFIIIISLIIIAFSGCMTEKRQNKLKKLLCHDYTITVTKDSLIKIPINVEDTASFRMYLKCDSLGQIYQYNAVYYQGKWTDLQGQLKNNIVYVKSTVKVHDTIVKVVTNTTTKTGANIVTNQLTKGQSFWLITGKICFSLLVILIILFILWKILSKKFGWVNPFIKK